MRIIMPCFHCLSLIKLLAEAAEYILVVEFSVQRRRLIARLIARLVRAIRINYASMSNVKLQ